MDKNIKRTTLASKINTIVFSTCLLFAVVCALMLYFTSNKILAQKYEENKTLLSVVFEQKREDIANEIFAEQEIALQVSLQDILKVKGIAGVGIYDKNGKLLFSSGMDFDSALTVAEMEILAESPVFNKRLKTDKNTSSYSAIISVIGEQLGYIKLYCDTHGINEQLQNIVIFFVCFFILLTLFISLLLNTLLSRFIIQPVLTLKNSMLKLDNGSLGVMVELTANDEIGDMGTVFNKMSTTLQQNHKALKAAVKTEAESSFKLSAANAELKSVNSALEQSNNALEQLNADLEKTVQKRTADLTASNTRLQREIEQREKIQEDLIRVQKLESTGVLAGGIAHDFNNLLSIIIGNITLAGISSKNNASLRRILEDTEKTCFRARDLTKQLLTFSRGGCPVKKNMDIKELVKETVVFALRGSNVDCSFDISPALLPANVDEGQINQVISNVVINAGHAMPRGGTVMVTAENIEIDAENTFSTPLPSGPYIKLSIRDNGTGISQKNLPSIFDPYFTTKATGSGLGLATAHSIIKKHEGFITVNSRESEGSTFIIYLPASLKKINDAPTPISGVVESKKKGQGKILVMDDEEMIRTVVGKILQHMGYRPYYAKDGVEACQKYLEALEMHEKFDAVLMDLTIPGGMGGKEAVREILKIDPQAKVIVSSGFSTDPVMADYASYGFCGVVAKPFMVGDLKNVLDKII